MTLAVAGGSAAWWAFFSGPKIPPPPDFSDEGIDRQVASAIRSRIEVLKKDPRKEENWGLLGQLFLAHNRHNEAEECLNVAMQLGPKNPRWPHLLGFLYRRKDTTKSIALFSRAKQLVGSAEPSERYLPTFQLAEIYLAEDDLDRAIAELDEIKADELDEISKKRIQFNRGLIACRLGQWEKARDLLLPLSTLPGARRRISSQLAIAYDRLGSPELARQFSDLMTTLPEDSSWPDPWASDSFGLKVGRISDLQLAGNLETHEDQGAARQFLLRMDQEAQGKDVVVQFALGMNFFRSNQLQKAETAFRQAIKVQPNLFRAHLMLAVLQLQVGEDAARAKSKLSSAVAFEDGYKHALKAVELAPQDAGAAQLAGELALHLNKNSEALELLARAAVGRAEDPRAYMYYGEALARAGDKEKALLHLQRAVKLADSMDKEPARRLERWQKAWTDEKKP
jgi:tetratricopeptide (TPR) repeat protein